MIITNNKKVAEAFENTRWVEGAYRDVLLAVRDYVYLGHKLITHPLGASIGQMRSPIRSVVLSDEKVHDEYSMETISQSIEKYDNTMGERQPQYHNQDDYEWLDLELLEAAFSELDKLKER